jgi:hypothetical protein
VFAVLERNLPSGECMAQMSFNNSSLSATIHCSFSVSQGRPKLPFGAIRYDAYGAPDFDSFYPSATSPDGCAPGRALADIKAQFAERINANRADATSASFGCNNNVKQPGVWYVRVPRKR